MKRQLSDEELQENVELVQKLVSKLSDARREQVQAMMDGPVGHEYFLAPASSKEEFHDCFPGGLMVHSLQVVKNLKSLADTLIPGHFDNATLSFVGLFHDLGKVGDGENSYYIPQESQWHREKLGQLYTINKECKPGPTSERGLFILQAHGISLSFDEWAAIRLNDGAYAEENKPYLMHEPSLALLLHFADRWACQQEKASK